MSNEVPKVADKLYLIQETSGQVIQAYWSGKSWHVAWGKEYTKADQPNVWAELNFPRTL